MKNHNQIFFRVLTYKLIIRSKPMKIPKTRRTNTKSSDWYPKNITNPSIFRNPKFGEITNLQRTHLEVVTPHLRRLRHNFQTPKSVKLQCLGMTIFARPTGTLPGSTLMGRVLPGPIRNRVRYGLKKTRSGSKLGLGFIKKPETRPKTRPG